MQVLRLFLDGNWDFQFDPSGIAEYTHLGSWRPTRVPAPWQAEFEDLRSVSGAGWYRRRFTIDELIYPEYQAAILHFGAVNYHATVWVNGNLIGEHEGGYLPFEFDVAAELRVGANLLVVRVVDPTDDRKRFPDWPFSEIPHGKQSWYGPIGGIWQGVSLEMRPKLHITSVKLTPDPATGRIAVQTRLSGALPANGRLSATAYGPDGDPVGSVALDIGGNGTIQLEQAPIWWSPESPNLYAVETTLMAAGATRHVTRHTCGFRTVEARNGRIYLNGAPIYLRGALDQAYYPETIYSSPSVAFLEDQAHKAKALGLNCLRTHIKVEDPRYYEVADRLGLLIWTEIPNWAFLSDAADRRIKETFSGMVERDWNHPSIIAWSLVNESWGLNLARNPEHRNWLAAFYQDAKEIDPTRLIVDNSACCDNFHVASDLEDFHAYFAIPDHAGQWDAWVENFADRTNHWTWAQDFRLLRRPDLPLIVSEFGNWGLPDPDSLLEKGKEPWWFETGHERDNGIVYPHGIHQRFMESGLAEVFGTLEAFTQFAQEHMARSLHYEISSMRLQPSLAGYVITEFTDVHWECNGLLTMQRQVKHGLDSLFAPINQDRVVVARPAVWSGHPGDYVPVALRCFDVDCAGEDGLIVWHTAAASGEMRAPGGIAQIPLHAPGMSRVDVQWVGADGKILAVNRVDLVCVVAPTPGKALCVVDDPALAAVLRGQGYEVTEHGLAAATTQGIILVAHHYTNELESALQRGARVVLLAGQKPVGADEIAMPECKIVDRAHTRWQGDWATAFSWLKKQGPFEVLPGSPLLEMEFQAVMPDAVVTGVRPWALRTHSWAGLTVGWIHSPVSLLLEMPCGRGRGVVTTFKLNAGTLQNDAVAQSLFGAILDLF